MGNQCSSVEKNCRIDFDSSSKKVIAFGDVTRGHFQTDPEIAGLGTVLSLVVPTAIGMYLSLILLFGLISDRIPRAVRFLNRYYVLRIIAPSPSQISPVRATAQYSHVLDAPYTSTHAFESSASTLGGHDLEDYSYAGPTPYWGSSMYAPGPYGGSGYQHEMDDVPLTSGTNDSSSRRTKRPGRGGRQAMPSKQRQRRDQEHRRYSPKPSRPPSTQPAQIVEVIEEMEDHTERETMSEKLYDVLEAILYSIPDAQILLAIALALSYSVRYGCLMSQYHWSVAFNLCVIGCTNFLLAFTLVRNYWQSPLAGVMRILFFAAVLGFLGYQVRLQTEADRMPERVPPNFRNDSLILLNAKCFTDTSIEGPLSNNTDGGVIDIVGGYEDANEPLYLCVVLGLFSFISLLVRGYQWFYYRTNGPRREQRRPGDMGEEFSMRSYLSFLWWGGTWIACISLYGVAAQRIFGAREWVAASGWVEGDDFSGNPENDVKGFGQIAAMVAAGAFIIAGADRWKPKSTRLR